MKYRAGARVFLSSVVIWMLLRSLAFAAADFRIYGWLYDQTGEPAAGYRLVFRDVTTNASHEAPTNASGAFTIIVPHRSFSLDSVRGLFGESYDVRTPVIITDGTAGVSVSVRLVRVPIAGGNGLKSSTVAEAMIGIGALSSGTAQNEKRNRMRSSSPWYKKPGPIVGVVLGSGVVAALALGSGGGGKAASASMP